MASTDELERLTSQELHDRAFAHAKRHLDVGFFWRLLELIPAAEAGDGDRDEGERDVLSLTARVRDLLHQDPELVEALRPAYVEYLARHADA